MSLNGETHMEDVEMNRDKAQRPKDATMEDSGDEGEMEPEVLLDSLPYIDFDFGDEESRRMVESLIAKEMENSEQTPQECLERLGLPPAPELDVKKSIFLSKEFERIEEGGKNPPVDMSRYALKQPTGKQENSFDAWAEAVEKAMVQLEHQTVSMVNVELLKRFGPNSWKSHNEFIEQMHQRLVKALQQQRKEMNDINLERSKAQTAAGGKYLSLEKDFQERVLKNHEIEFECRTLEQELERMKKRLKKMEKLKNGGGSKKKQKTTK